MKQMKRRPTVLSFLFSAERFTKHRRETRDMGVCEHDEKTLTGVWFQLNGGLERRGGEVQI